MQEQTFSLKDSIAYHQEKHKAAYNRVEAVIDRMVDLYEQAEKSILTGKDHQQVISDMNEQLLTLRPLKTMREHFVHYYRKFSSLIRRLQNGNKNTNTAFSRFSRRRQSNGLNKEQKNSERFKKYFSSFITEDRQKNALQNMIVQHFLRQGKFECAKVWENEMNALDPSRLFYECHKIKDKIKKGHFQDAIVWCENQNIYNLRQCFLEYELIKLDIVSLVEKGKAEQALSVYTNKIPKFIGSKSGECKQLMGFILSRSKKYWAEDLQQFQNLVSFCNERYKSFICTDEKCEEIAQEFVKEYLKHNNINQFDVLNIVYNCSKKISEEYQRLMVLTWEGEGKSTHPKKYDTQLPFSIQLDNSYQYHSLFLCPVTKQVQSSGDQSVLLSCGHMISKTAQDRIIQESRSRRRVRCPICQKDIHPQDSIAVEY